jgi:hypothetical protein
MKTLEYRYIDKSTWGAGAWNDEPDKVQWLDTETGLPCLIVRHCRHGQLCGYVGVPGTHPYFGRSYNAVDVDVHGGLTFADRCQPGDENRAICHVVEPGEDDAVWWLGFDCHHAGDLAPGTEALLREIVPERHAAMRELGAALLDELGGYQWRDVYRDIGYVREQVLALARQLKDATPQ